MEQWEAQDKLGTHSSVCDVMSSLSTNYFLYIDNINFLLPKNLISSDQHPS